MGEPSRTEPSAAGELVPGPAVPGQRARSGSRRVAGGRAGHLARRVIVGVVGGLVVVLGLVLIPFPGPGWLIVFAGLGILATEFDWAARLLDFARAQVGAWTAWLLRQRPAVRALVALATGAVVLAALWLALALTGVPGWLPDAVTDRLTRWVPGL